MSTNPYGRQSGLNTTPVVALAAGAQVFTKATAPATNSASEPGDTLRIIKNTHGSVTAYIASSQAGCIDTGLSYPLAPGEAITLLGPSGIGWGGDLWASSAGDAVSIAVIKA